MDNQNMETRMDFLVYLGKDASMHIMSRLDDTIDLVHASCVSRSWYHFVISNRFTKKLCMKTCPQLSDHTAVALENDNIKFSNHRTIDINTVQQTPEKDHQVYAALLHAIKNSKVPPENCLFLSISTSSRHRYTEENFTNPVNRTDISPWSPTYWSSKGQSNPDVPETVLCLVKSNTWLITEVDIQPFQAFFQPGEPIYSPKSVRIWVGHAKDRSKLSWEHPEDDNYEWSYTSPEFPMVQENRLQQFKLPEPVLCMRGHVKIELLGRVQRQESDGLFYICLDHVRVMGRSLYPAFDVEVRQPEGKLVVTYDRKSLSLVMQEDLYGQVQKMYQIFF